MIIALLAASSGLLYKPQEATKVPANYCGLLREHLSCWCFSRKENEARSGTPDIPIRARQQRCGFSKDATNSLDMPKTERKCPHRSCRTADTAVVKKITKFLGHDVAEPSSDWNIPEGKQERKNISVD